MVELSPTRLAANGVEFAIEQGGDGPTVLLVNGTGATIATSQPLHRALRRNCHLVAFDHRGMGGSSSPSGPWTMLDYANDVAGIIETLGLHDCAVLGISFGGMVAQEFAVRYPDAYQRLILWSTSAGGEAGSSYDMSKLRTMSDAEREAMRPLLADSRFTPEWLDAHPQDRALVGEAATPSEREQATLLLQLGARAGHDVASRLGLISAPTLIGSGRYDMIAPPENAKAIEARISTSQRREYEGGHLFFFQDPQGFRDLATFLSGD